MMRNPYQLTGPTCLSFSGGRTSAYMLRMVLDNNTAEDLARWLAVCFANTGLEAEETLVFVHECATRWGVKIVWLEYTGHLPEVEKRGKLANALMFEVSGMYKRVTFETASRNGEPFEALIQRRKFLPNPVSRFCTSELKIRTMHRYIRAELQWDEWDQFIGIRADEQRRVSKIRVRGTSTETKDETMCLPLADAGATLVEVGRFWDAQPFKLNLTVVNGKTIDGNCVYCFNKSPWQRLSIARMGKHSIDWYVRAEDGSMVPGATGRGARFTKDGPSYADIKRFAADQQEMFDHNQEDIPCFCGD